MASQSAFTRKKTVEDILEENTKKLDKFAIDSSKKDAELSKNIKNIHIALDNIKLYVKTALSNKALEGTTSQAPNTPPPPVEDNARKASDKSVGAWVPPESSEEKKNNKSMLKNISSTLSGLRKKSEENSKETRAGLLWNKEAAKKGWNKEDSWKGGNTPFLGKLTNAIVGGLGQSLLFQNPYMKFIKALLSPAGILVMYFIGKMFKKHIWDPYIGPVLKFYNENVKPVITSILSFFTEEAMPFLKSLFPKWSEVKKSFNELLNVYKDPKATIGDKIAQSLLTGDLLLAPITNIVKWAFSEYLGVYAKIFDSVGLSKFASWTTDIQKQIVDTMHGTFKDVRLKALQESEMGQKYPQMWGPDFELALIKKIKNSEALSTGEKILTDSDRWNAAYGTTGMSQSNANKSTYEDFLRYETRKYHVKGAMKYDPASEINIADRAKILYEQTAMSSARKILSELRGKKFSSEDDTISYIKQILLKNENLSRSADAQNEVLKELVKMLREQGKLTDAVLAETQKLGIKAFETTNINNTMINNSGSTIRNEKLLINTGRSN